MTISKTGTTYSRKSWAQRQLVSNSSRKYKRAQLSLSVVESLQNKTLNCSCCCVPLDYSITDRKTTRNGATLDCVVPALGYSPKNLQIICYWCNLRKSDMGLEQLEMLADYIRQHSPK